ncbi:hypothetical protein B0H16DRAFT_169623 [Mycena metata]|uniref:ubiquitinyl hydrolase 1 n=1 Tax=Mycena metata TaxID=1033252 RepID=A0AAD7JXM0_9AGAR|nr:hypothetical protein B0H16DRAFT_169623 [Mycena metata]
MPSPAVLLPVLQQTAPLLVLVLVPLFALRIFAFLRPRLGFLVRILALGMALLGWLGLGSSSSPSPSSLLDNENEDERRRKKAGGRVRTRADQVANRTKSKTTSTGGSSVGAEDTLDARFPGLVNMSGTHCFMNSTLQALASLHALPPYLLAIRARAEATDVPTPVVDALLDLLAQLNTPSSSSALRPVALVEALCTPLVCAPATSELDAYPTNSTSSKTAKHLNDTFSSALTAFWDARGAATVPTGSSTKATALLASHEHQDAQELFQLLSECVREEAARVGKEGGGRGIAAVATGAATSSSSAPGAASSIAFPASGGVGLAAALDDEVIKPSTKDDVWHPPPSPFDGLTATRRACVRCGYTAAIRHFSFDSVQLALDLGAGGGGWGGASLSALLASYTALEVLHDCPCRRCALRATARRLAEEVAKLESGSGSGGGGGEQINGMIVTNGHLGNGHHADDHDDAGKEREHRKEKEHGKEQPTPSRLRRLKAVRRMEARVRWALEAGRIEEEELEGEWEAVESGGGGMLRSGSGSGSGSGGGDALKGVRIERVAGGVCTRQSMLGRPPPILALHINRSVHTGLRTVKNGARVAGGRWEGGANDTEKMEKGKGVEECLYRLSAVVCHYGQHAFGHYVCYRRAPVAVSSSTTPFSADSTHAPAPPTREGTGAGWLRISDARVDRVGVEAVLAEGSSVFMLYYERVVPDSSSSTSTIAKMMTASVSAPLASLHAPTSTPTLPISSSMPSLPTVTAVYAGAGALEGEADSAETLRPGQFAGVHAPAVNADSRGGSASGMAGLLEAPKARVVRSVSLGMGRGVRRGGVGSSESSLRSVSPSSSFVSVASSLAPEAEGEGDGGVPGTPRARAVEQSGEEVDVIVLSPEKGDDRAEDATTLPTPPPTPRSTVSPSPPPPSSTPSASPSPTKTQKRKKKKGGKGE